MKRLAFNTEAVLMLCGREYWVVIAKDWQVYCLNDRSEEYRAINALTSFEASHGKAIIVHKDIKLL